VDGSETARDATPGVFANTGDYASLLSPYVRVYDSNFAVATEISERGSKTVPAIRMKFSKTRISVALAR
jgi:hypothetical protein